MILLDTHTWVWWLAAPERLSRAATRAITSALGRAQVGISCFSVWELAMLVERGRLRLSLELREWVAGAEQIQGLRFYPVTNAIALESVRLPGAFHADPADRIIVATARLLGASLVSGDDKIRQYPHVKALW